MQSWVRLCGFGVALSAETEVGQFRSDRVCRKGTNMWKNLVPGGTRTHDITLVGLMLYLLSHDP